MIIGNVMALTGWKETLARLGDTQKNRSDSLCNTNEDCNIFYSVCIFCECSWIYLGLGPVLM